MTADDINTIKMHPERGSSDRETLYSVLDEGFVCHVAFAVKDQPFNIPMTYVRINDSLFLHGSKKSRIYNELQSGAKACITVTFLDGIILGKSIYNSSMNYRSAMLFGKLHSVEDVDEKMKIAEKLTEKMAAGRWDDCRRPTSDELETTGFLEMKIDKFSTKARSGPLKDNPNDLKEPYWTGELPVKLTIGNPIPSSDSIDKVELPEYLKKYVHV